MRTAWMGIVLIVVALGWLYFSAKLRTLRLRVPPVSVPPGRRDARSPG